MGSSRPWQEVIHPFNLFSSTLECSCGVVQALEAVTGTKQMNGTAILRFFAPLNTWLQQYNQKHGELPHSACARLNN